MPGWKGSTRGQRLPGNWRAIRKRILSRDRGTCRRCGKPATDVDHIVAGDNHEDSNLIALCKACHLRKSSAEGGRAVHKGKRERKVKPWREPKKHPGLL